MCNDNKNERETSANPLRESLLYIFTVAMLV